MELKDFMDLSKLQKIQDAFSDATGLAAIAVGKNGEYITEGSNFTDFCMKYTRNSVEGNRRCVKCDNECTGTYYCHAGLMDFAFDIMLNDEKVGAIIGGQVLPSEPDDEQFRQTARELGQEALLPHSIRFRSVPRSGFVPQQSFLVTSSTSLLIWNISVTSTETVFHSYTLK